MYEYDVEFPDKLTKFDGNVIEYNSAGCPSKYKDENYEWANGKLSRIHRCTVIQDEEHYTTRTFTYDGYGRRTQKHSVTGVNYSGADAVNSYSHSHTNDYTYDNSGRLIREVYTRRDSSGTVRETRELVYLYDESGIIGAMYSYNGSTLQPYYYHRNLQGDVIAIYDANGEKQVEYAYDAWGNCEVICADTQWLAYANPIRYRGYYYDEDTKLYYLNARYYSPEWRRFISPASAETLNANAVNGLNLYSYANNNSVDISYNTSSVGRSASGRMVNSLTLSSSPLGKIGGNNSNAYRNMPLIPDWIKTASSIADPLTSFVGPIRTAFYAFTTANLWDVMRLDGIDELPGLLSKSMKIAGYGLAALNASMVGYEKYASGASTISSLAGAGINLCIGIGSIHVSTLAGGFVVGLLSATTLAGGWIVLLGAGSAFIVGATVNFILTDWEIGGNTIEGHLNDFVDWLIWWD